MSYTININQTGNGISEIALEGELSLKNAEGLKNDFLSLSKAESGYLFAISNIQALDITFIQLLIAFKTKAISENKKFAINWSLNDDLTNILESTGLLVANE
ncbi:MAG: STAS domain-containing protein [Bacteroidota bacterium]